MSVCSLKSQESTKIGALLSNIRSLSTSMEVTQGNEQSPKKKGINDKQMQLAKLRYLENCSELRKADSELRQQRRVLSPKKLIASQSVLEHENYRSIYQRSVNANYSENKVKNQSQEDEEESEINQNGVFGLKYYSQLKKRPLLLEYTIERLQKIKSRHIIQKEAALQSLRQGSNPQLLNAFVTVPIKKQSQQAQQIVRKHFTKLYSKNTKGDQIHIKALESEVSRRIMLHQNHMIKEGINRGSLSLEGKQKLKCKLNEIINEIGKHDKKTTEIYLPPI